MTNTVQNQTGQNGSTAVIQEPNLHQSSARDIDPNVLQLRASDPFSSVWVSASAGSGKTKVLTDRVLRLLLPKSENEPGTPIHKILCLTFTKAAASEMALRVSSILAQWAVTTDHDLTEKLESLLGRPPKDFEIQAARRLFASVVDRPFGGLQIMTIHSFCQSLLGRFPLESGIGPAFEMMDESEASAMLSAARHSVFTTPENAEKISAALNHLASHLSEMQLEQLLSDITKEREQFRKILNDHGDLPSLISALCKTYGIEKIMSTQDVYALAAQPGRTEQGLRHAASTLGRVGTSSDQKRAQTIIDWLEQDQTGRIKSYKQYKSAYLTGKNAPTQKLCTKVIIENHPDVADILLFEQQRILEIEDALKKHICAGLTRDLFIIADCCINEYSRRKKQLNLLDFDDLIEKTSKLLSNAEHNHATPMSSWVLFKLDQGLDHILVDEAQDTNPEQWQILRALCEEFYAGIGARDDTNRSLFVVGDEKQSIYSFQRASPEEFQSMRAYFSRRIEQAEKRWEPVNLNISFRTTKSVLRLVDAVFNHTDIPRDPGFDAVEHIAFRNKEAGLAELWPVFENEDEPPSLPWDPPVEIEETRSGAQKCASYIAETIAQWLKTKQPLEARNRPIHAGDIMILVKSRNAFVGQLIRALKHHNIPVTGQDRMVLCEQLVVKDLCALAEFALYPADDLTLAALLKSPFIGMSEEELYDIAVERGKASLWQRLQAVSKHQEITTYLRRIRDSGRRHRPYEFFAHALQMPCPADPNSGLRAVHARLGDDSNDPLEEFLSQALNFETKHTPSLQGFIQYFKSEHVEIKRQLEEVRDAVRIMTVHGSKGLQAPIVILPDTIRIMRRIPSQIDKRLLWPQKTGLATPIFSPRSETDFDLYKDTFKVLEDRDDEEYRRLLYVAMTRAEDRLYITGYKGKKTPIPQSWYNYCAQAFDALEDITTVDEQALEAYGCDTRIKRLYNPQLTDDYKPEKSHAANESTKPSFPDWLLKHAPDEPSPPRPLMPSRPSQKEQSVLSPLDNKNDRFRRGNLTHKLLQILPEIEINRRELAAQKYLKAYAADMSEITRASIITETLTILNDPDFSDLFGPQSMSEVPVTGLIGTEIISGQIDRIVITNTTVKIVDYKTNRPPPTDPKDVPEIYYNQLKAYNDALQKIYPDKIIQCALLWTDGPYLMPLDVSN